MAHRRFLAVRAGFRRGGLRQGAACCGFWSSGCCRRPARRKGAQGRFFAQVL